MTISKPIEKAPTTKESLLVASETSQEEAQLELEQLLEQFKEWKEENSGGWKDFLNSSRDEIKVKRINLSAGGDVEKYGDLIDAYIKKIDVLEGESLTQYINRVRAAEAKAKTNE